MRILLGIIYIVAGNILQEFVREIQNDDTMKHCEIFIAKPSLAIIITYYVLLQRAGVSRAYILHTLISE